MFYTDCVALLNLNMFKSLKINFIVFCTDCVDLLNLNELLTPLKINFIINENVLVNWQLVSGYLNSFLCVTFIFVF